MISARQLVRRGMAVTLPRGMYMVSGPTHSRNVSLTFDDGPHPEHTPALLDALKERKIRATFFLLGRQIERHPDIVRRLADEGHDVGHHSYSHSEPSTTSALALGEEVRRVSGLLERLVGRAPRLFRPPHGKITAAKALVLWAARQTIVLWNQDPKDFACESTDALAAWFAARTLAGGDVILLHDVHPHAGRAVGAIADGAARAGLGFCPISEWVAT